MYLTLALSDAPSMVDVALAVLAAGGALIAQAQVRLTRRLAAVEVVTLPADPISRILRYSRQITPESPSLVYHFVEQESERMSDFLKEIVERGEIHYDGEDRDWLLRLTDHAQVTIDAVSLASVDRGFWTSEIGTRYLGAQRAAVERGVKVRRIFLIDQPGGGIEPEVRRTCEQQSRMGIEIRTLDRARIPEVRRVDGLGFIIFDRLMTYEIIPSSMEDKARSVIAETRLVLREKRVQKSTEIYRDLWEEAAELPPLSH
ncbi:hypothetical protein [Catenuloplanes indicus]|uniref:Uncharacterized protein n=1 Tax=Catenuloplanes indicus TaxID=137267 RepID=A0AAE4B0H9_9ACTN|nr:hypothetical protein [Catenuloplanes indicus]MDQ0369587.1 hypothetical protein [Catenuloplanes indicus]